LDISIRRGKFDEKRTMEKLPEKLKKNGYEYHQLKRSDNAALYGQYIIGGKVIQAYEAFIIREQKEGTSTIGGAVVNFVAKELFPSDEEFGRTAWSFNDLKRAELCFEGLCNIDSTIKNT
jgi:hypothetical protein